MVCTHPHRGELPDSEDVTSIDPKTLRSRPPTLTFMCLLAILDPPREEVIEAVKVAHTAGICVKMITGLDEKVWIRRCSRG